MGIRLYRATVRATVRARVTVSRNIILLYGDDSSQSQSSTRDLGEFTGIEGQSGKDMCQGGKPDTGKFHSSLIIYWYVE